MEKIERKINSIEVLNFNFIRIWGTSYNAKNKRELKNSPRIVQDMKRYFKQLTVDGSLVGITSVDPLSNYK